MTSDKEWEAKCREMERLQLEVETKKAYLRGRLDSSMEDLRKDEVWIDALRAKEWLRADPTLDLRLRGEEILGVPDGWPEGVDGEAVLDDWVAQKREELEPRPGAAAEPEAGASRLVDDFRKKVEAAR